MRFQFVGGRGEQIPDLGEDHVAGQLHFAAADVGAGAPLGRGQADRRRRATRSAIRPNGVLTASSVEQALPKRSMCLLGALAPEGKALAGRDIGVQRGAQVEQQLGALADGVGRPLAADCRSRFERVFILQGPIAEAGGGQQTDDEAGDAHGPAEHRKTESSSQ